MARVSCFFLRHDFDGTGECVEAGRIKPRVPRSGLGVATSSYPLLAAWIANTGFLGNQWRESGMGDAGKLMHGVLIVFKRAVKNATYS